jgi:hypothetical protein
MSHGQFCHKSRRFRAFQVRIADFALKGACANSDSVTRYSCPPLSCPPLRGHYEENSRQVNQPVL